MFRLLVLLCLMMLATFYTLGARDDAPLRDGLAGKYAPLAAPRAPAAPAQQTVAPAATAPAAEAPAPVPTSVASATRAARPPLSAAFAAAQPADGDDGGAVAGLTLALPTEGSDAAVALSVGADPASVSQTDPVVRYVTGTTVNLREGPSVETASLNRLGRGDAVLVLQSDTPGWSLIRIEETGLEGFVASRFLGDAPGDGIFTPVN